MARGRKPRTMTMGTTNKPSESQNQTANIGFSDSDPQDAPRTPQDAPSATKERKPRGRPAGVVGAAEELQRIEGMLRLASTATVAVTSRFNETDALIVAQHTIIPSDTTPNLIAATMELCKQDAKVRKYLAGLAKESAYLNVAVAAGSMTIALLANHKLLPPMFVPKAPESPKAPEVYTNGSTILG